MPTEADIFKNHILLRLQSTSGEELSTLMASMLRPSGVGVQGRVVMMEKKNEEKNG